MREKPDSYFDPFQPFVVTTEEINGVFKKSLFPLYTPYLNALVSAGFEKSCSVDGRDVYRRYSVGGPPPQVEPPLTEERHGELVRYDPAKDTIDPINEF